MHAERRTETRFGLAIEHEADGLVEAARSPVRRHLDALDAVLASRREYVVDQGPPDPSPHQDWVDEQVLEIQRPALADVVEVVDGGEREQRRRDPDQRMFVATLTVGSSARSDRDLVVSTGVQLSSGWSRFGCL